MARNPLTKLRKQFGDQINLELKRGQDPKLEANPDILLEVCQFLNENDKLKFSYLADLTAIDYSEYIELLYYLFSPKLDSKLILKSKISSKKPAIESMVSVWSGANWLEREAYDMFEFRHHPNLSRILLTEDNEAFPLRKDFQLKERQFQGAIVEQVEK